MELKTKIKLEKNVFINFNYNNSELYFELNKQEEEEKLFLYKKNENKYDIKHKDVFYEKIRIPFIEKMPPLEDGFYLFVFNKTKLYVEIFDNRITFEIDDDIGIEEIDSLR